MENRNNGKVLFYSIIAVLALIAVVAGGAYAYYQASANDATAINGTAGGGAAPTLTVTKESTSDGKLIPITMTAAELTNGAKGWNTANSQVNSSWNASQSCIDKHGYTVCQVYSVTVTNNADLTQSFEVELSSLTGPTHIEAVKMSSNILVEDASSINANNNRTICTVSNLAKNASNSNSKCYFMVFIQNLTDSAQEDSGAFSGVVTATSTTGAHVQADFTVGG